MKRERFAELDPALEAAERLARDALRGARRGALDVKVRQFEPAQQVAARIELAGPQRFLASVRGGLDVRGDGSTIPYRGRVNRQVIDQRRGESAYAALRRSLQAG